MSDKRARVLRKPPTAVIALAVLLVVPALVPVWTSVEAGSSEESGDTELRSDDVRWDAPDNLIGTFVARFLIEVPETTFCWTNVTATGNTSRAPEDPIVFWMATGIQDGPDFAGMSGTMWSRSVQAHIGSAVDTRQFTTSDGRWGTVLASGQRVRDVVDVTLATFGLEASDPDQSPLRISIACDDPYSLELFASRDGRSFTQQSLQDGVGATAETNTPIVPDSKRTAVSHDDHLEHTFDTSQVYLQSEMFTYGGADEDAEEMGTMVLDHPDGSESWTKDRDDPDVKWVFAGGAGDYDLTLDWAGHGRSKGPMGVLVGFDPVDSLDDAL